MAELSDLGRRLIDTAMAHDEPPSVDQSWGTLVSRITGEAAHEPMPPATAPVRSIAVAAHRRSRGIPAVAAALVVAAIVWWRLRPDPSSPVVDPPAPPVPAPVVAVAPTKPAVAPEPPLEQLLVDAEAALAAGDPSRALALLRRHAERAAIDPHATRRIALRVLALCAAGERAQARDEGHAFLASHPDSPWSDAVRRSCAATEG